MIIAQHRKFTPVNILYVVLLGTFMCLGVFFHLPDQLTPILFEPAISNLIGFSIGSTLSPQENVLITLVLTLLQAFFLNSIINYFNFLGKPNFLTALMFMTLVSLFIPFLVLSPTLICNFITIWMLSKLFNIYKQPDVKGLMFDLGMIVAFGSLIYFPFMVMLLLLWISLIIFRPFNWREWVAPLLGFANIYFILAVIYYWLDRMPEFFQIFVPLTYPFPTVLEMDLYDFLVVIPIILILLFFIYILKDQFYKSVVHIRKSFQLLFFMIVLVGASFYLNEHITVNHFLLCAPALAIYMAYYFMYAKNKWVYESLYLLTVATIIYFQFM
ncbi:beta-carotene 15,15'-monooxygenase [Sphingobacterium hungaricum]|uniref:Beta-carotene 15,15'-monooxygenase n=1 Tax=Sphingobacterium hungaricum TaxID=2082723 RepID=A0A928UYJ9_9SPHI|nr:beta-carotene 15,15'-monooxygenase [Sphingobacterium hungaricum]MBE8713469.1 beta-carotene 15,15'-monooxygenase [Sphingobacterium hungaricum]